MQAEEQRIESPEEGDVSTDCCAARDENFDAGAIQMNGLRLPPPRPARWVPHRKAEVVAAVRGGYISIDQACERYALSVEEYLTWQRGIDLFGLAGLRVNKVQNGRRLRTGYAEGRLDS